MSSKKELLVETALELFNQRGYALTGIDLILQKSGISKRTLYKYFPSKTDLVLAVLKKYEEDFYEWLVKASSEGGNTPEEQLIAIFDAAKTWFRRSNFYGCLMIQAAGEFTDKRSAIRRLCKEAKGLQREYMKKLAQNAGLKNPEQLANQIALLFEGALVTSQVSDVPRIADDAKKAVIALIDGARGV